MAKTHFYGRVVGYDMNRRLETQEQWAVIELHVLLRSKQNNAYNNTHYSYWLKYQQRLASTTTNGYTTEGAVKVNIIHNEKDKKYKKKYCNTLPDHTLIPLD